METLKRHLKANGLTASQGFIHVLLHHGDSRKAVYRAMYGQLIYGGKIAEPGTTLVYPEEIRSVVRERFPDPSAGTYDAQYSDDKSSRHLTLTQMVAHQWRSPPASCALCRKPTSKPY
ncbi:uncharacterized protein [Haliotis asinina]|uniref:uncharacterized protein n=1 Tax=Haliotis asinina TaxID=109174 RepID=UPI0035320174